MRVLVVAASKHGSTAEIATALGEALARRGLSTTVADARDVADIEEYDAVVLGSAVYAGRWQKAARELAETHGEFLRSRPVWLFSSGPVGDPPKPEEDPVDVAQITTIVGSRGHRVFAGRLDKSRLSLAERAIVRSLKVPEGDWRNWDEIAAWAGEIADALAGGAAG
ncbi:MAG: flavodoxin domain-containing protein [Acidimicrobiia bacterium]|nr:flavodoxin domain-containing protein [Acidimicrobiia bacterium]